MMKYLLMAALLLSGCGLLTATQPAAVGRRSVPMNVSSGPSWAMEGGDPARASVSSFSLPDKLGTAKMLKIVQKRGYYPEEDSTPIVVGEIAYLGSSDRRFTAYDLKNEEVVWQIKTTGRIFTTAAYADSTLVFGDDAGELRAVGLDGTEIWRFKTLYPIVSSPFILDGVVIAAVSNHTVFSIDLKTGEPVWKYERKFPARNSLWRASAPASGEGKIFAGFSDGVLVALEARLGKVLWIAEIGGKDVFPDVSAGPAYKDGKVYVGTLSGPTVCLNAETGSEIWRSAEASLAGFAVGGKLIYTGAPNGAAKAFDALTGDMVWETMLDGGAPTRPVLADNRLAVGASDGSLYLLDAQSGKIADRYFPGQGLHSQPLVYEGGLMFFSDGGKIHWFKRDEKWDLAAN